MTAPEVQGFAIFPDGSHLFLWKDVDRTLRELERISPADAKGFLEFGIRLRRFGQLMRPFIFCAAPPRRSDVMRAFEDAGESELYNEFILGSTNSLLEKYFSSDHIKGFLTLYGLVSVWAGPDTPEGAYLYGYHATGEFEKTTGRWAFVKGGMGGITQALARAAEARGVHIRVNAPVERDHPRGRPRHRRQAGLRRGAESRHRHLQCPSQADIPEASSREATSARGFKEAIERIDTKGAMARVHLLVDQLPHYVGFDSAAEGWQHRGHAVLGCSIENFQKAYVAQLKGVFPDELAVELIIQSVSDPSLAPPGQHTITLGVQHTPFELAEGDWDSRKEEWGDLVCETVFRYAPNLRNHVLGRHIITPLDLQRDYNLLGGNIFHVPMTLEYAFDARPAAVSGGYRTAIGGLYLCGAGTHPGGAVTGAPGRNAAQAVLEDRWAACLARDKPGRSSSRGLVDQLMESEIGAKLGYGVARHPSVSAPGKIPVEEPAPLTGGGGPPLPRRSAGEGEMPPRGFSLLLVAVVLQPGLVVIDIRPHGCCAIW